MKRDGNFGPIDPEIVRRSQAKAAEVLRRARRVALSKAHFGRALTEARQERIWAVRGFGSWEAFLEEITLGDVELGRECMRQYQAWFAVSGSDLPVLEPEPDAKPPNVPPQAPSGEQQELFPGTPSDAPTE